MTFTITPSDRNFLQSLSNEELQAFFDEIMADLPSQDKAKIQTILDEKIKSRSIDLP